jgi:hypothetical protein
MPEGRTELIERAGQALALERSYIAGSSVEHAGAQALAGDIADHLRALLRDVVCGHLSHDLVALADELLIEPEPEPEPAVALDPEMAAIALEPAIADQLALAEELAPDEASVEQMLGDLGQPEEILDVFI